jgi:hypothetical protein
LSFHSEFDINLSEYNANQRIEDSSLSAEEQASFNVDALVNDTDNDPVRVLGTPLALATPFLEQPRRATPTIPPGFTAPAIPRAIAEESRSRPGSRPMSRTTSSNITPAVPVVPATPKQVATPTKAKKAKQKIEISEPAPPATPVTVKPQPETPSKAAIKTPATKVQTPADSLKKAKESSVDTTKAVLEEKKSSPAAAVGDLQKAKTPGKKGKGTLEVTPKTDSSKDTKPVVAVLSTPSSKRQPPGKLDIAAATKLAESEQVPVSTPIKPDGPGKIARSQPAASTTSVPPSPAAAMTGSPIKRSVAPRTLRVVPTPKTEVPPPLSATSAPSLPQIPTVDKLRSRQASIASINQPGTPASELISDTASVTSTSMSRANSPPPIGGKVGTAPVRKKTKSQAKKDRQERKRQIEEEIAADDKSDVEVVQAPIVGRKKKEKKPSNPPKSIAAAFKSQPGSPKPATVEEEHSDAPISVSRKGSSAVASARETPEPEPEHVSEQPKDRRDHTAQSIMTDLQRTGELLASTLEFFKPLSSSLTHASRNTQPASAVAPPDLKIHFSEADLEALAKKKPVRLNGHDGKPDSRTLITPSGKFFWGLSEELEAKALELEKHIEELKGHTRFHPRHQTAHTQGHGDKAQSNDVLPAIATALKEAGKKFNTNASQQMPKLDPSSGLLGSTGLPLPPTQAPEVSPPQAPPPPQQQQQQTPADAGQYLNQFVLPKTDNPPPNQPRPEMAAVGGPPGAGTANISVNVNKFAKAAKAVVEGGAVGSTEIDGMGMMAADFLGGVFVQGLEALVGAGLGFQSSQEFGLDGNGNITLGRGSGGGIDVQGLMHAIESTAGMGGYGGAERRGRGSVLSMEEAEQAMHAAKKEHDVLEKKLAALMKKNKKLALGAGRG